MMLVNAWTHAIVVFELLFGILIWVRPARPLLLGLAVVAWGLLALVTGQVAFCAMMVIANMCFLPPSLGVRIRRKEPRRPAEDGD
jgi:hypothetical protein